MLLSSRHEGGHAHAGPIEVGSCGGPTLPLFPAPWRLKGNGLIVLTRAPLAQLKADPAIPGHIRESLKAPLNVLMLVNYTESDCGPYQELLFVPGTALIADRRLPTISNIFVSSESSVVNGRLNWGIPKYRCNFQWDRPGERSGAASQSDVAGAGGAFTKADGKPAGKTASKASQKAAGLCHVSASQDGQNFFEISYESSGLRLPMNTAWIPLPLKTLGQEWEGRQFIFSPSAKGRAKRATIRHLNVAAGLFPQISAQQVVAAFEITDFNMEFPVPQIL